MSAERVFEYWKAMTPIEAREMLNQIQVHKFPHMEKKARRRFENSLVNQSKDFLVEKKEVLTTAQVADRLMKAQYG